MNLFNSKKTPDATSKFPKLEALAGKAVVATADADAANEELRAAGITNAAIITEAAYNALAEKAGRVDAAEKSANDLKAENATLKGDNTTLKADLGTAQAEVKRLGALGGDKPTTAAKAEGDDLTAEAGKTPSYFDPNALHNQEAAALLS